MVLLFKVMPQNNPGKKEKKAKVSLVKIEMIRNLPSVPRLGLNSVII